MKIAKLIQGRLRGADVNAAIAANVDERGQVTAVDSTQLSPASPKDDSSLQETNEEGSAMPEEQPESEDAAREGLEEQDGEVLPRREVMSIVDLGDGTGAGPIHTLPVEPRDEV